MDWSFLSDAHKEIIEQKLGSRRIEDSLDSKGYDSGYIQEKEQKLESEEINEQFHRSFFAPVNVDNEEIWRWKVFHLDYFNSLNTGFL